MIQDLGEVVYLDFPHEGKAFVTSFAKFSKKKYDLRRYEVKYRYVTVNSNGNSSVIVNNTIIE